MKELSSKVVLVQLRQRPVLRIGLHSVFGVTQEYASQSTQLANPIFSQHLDSHVRGMYRSVHLLWCQLLVHDRFLQPQTPQPHMPRRNAVRTAPRVVNEALTVGGNDDRTTAPEVLQLDPDSQRGRARCVC